MTDLLNDHVIINGHRIAYGRVSLNVGIITTSSCGTYPRVGPRVDQECIRSKVLAVWSVFRLGGCLCVPDADGAIFLTTPP